MQPESQMTPEQTIDSIAAQEPSVNLTSAERDQLIAGSASGVYTREQLQRRVEQLKIQKLGDSLRSIAQLNTVGFILEQPFVTANAGDRVEFHGFFVNLTDADIKIGGYGAGIIEPSGLHGAAFPFTYNEAFPSTLSRLSVLGPMHLFTVELLYGSLRPSDQSLIGHAAPAYKDAADTTEGNYRGTKPAFFQIHLSR